MLAVPALHKDGRQISIEFSIQLLEDAGGRIEWVVAIIRDVTERFLREKALRARAKARGVAIGQYAERLLDGPLPWTSMRQGYELLRLCDRYGQARVEVVCKRALEFDVIDVPRVGRMCARGIYGGPASRPRPPQHPV